MTPARLHRAEGCRCDHRVVTERRVFNQQLERATVGHLSEWLRQQFPAGYQAETRRGVWHKLRRARPISRERVFADVLPWAADEELAHAADLPLREIGLTARDRLRARPADGQPDVWVTLTD